MLVTTDKAGRFNVCVSGYWYLGLSPVEALRLGATRHELAAASAQHSALELPLPKFNGKHFTTDGLPWSKRENLDYLTRSIGFSRDDAQLILEVAEIIHRIERATGITIS